MLVLLPKRNVLYVIQTTQFRANEEVIEQLDRFTVGEAFATALVHLNAHKNSHTQQTTSIDQSCSRQNGKYDSSEEPGKRCNLSFRR